VRSEKEKNKKREGDKGEGGKEGSRERDPSNTNTSVS